jgi:glycosyltransferase involved in cell wall biosynthesis
VTNVPKHILIFSQFYEPEPCAASNRVASLAHSLADRGHHVTVATGMPVFPMGVVDAPYRGLRYCQEKEGGVTVVRRRARIVSTNAFAGRLRNWISLAVVWSWAAWFDRRRVETVIVSSPPITMAIPAMLASWRHRAPLVVDVRDVFPDMGVRLGVWRSHGLMTRALGRFVQFLYGRASIVVAVTESARDAILARGVPARRVMLAPNGFDFSQKIEPRRRSSGDAFDVAYAGNMGLAAGLDLILDAAHLLLGHDDIQFTLAGGGVDAAHLLQRIKNENLYNVHFVGVLSRTQSLNLLARADATIVPLHPGLVDAIPSKMFDALAVGCPMILSARGESVRLLRASGGGIHVEPNDAHALVEGILRCRRERDRFETGAVVGQAFVRRHFDRKHIMFGLATAIGALG